MSLRHFTMTSYLWRGHRASICPDSHWHVTWAVLLFPAMTKWASLCSRFLNTFIIRNFWWPRASYPGRGGIVQGSHEWNKKAVYGKSNKNKLQGMKPLMRHFIVYHLNIIFFENHDKRGWSKLSVLIGCPRAGLGMDYQQVWIIIWKTSVYSWSAQCSRPNFWKRMFC